MPKIEEVINKFADTTEDALLIRLFDIVATYTTNEETNGKIINLFINEGFNVTTRFCDGNYETMVKLN